MEKEKKWVYKESGISFSNKTILEALNTIHTLRMKYGDDMILEQYHDYDSEYNKYCVVEIRQETDEEFNRRVEIQELWNRSEYERLKKIYG